MDVTLSLAFIAGLVSFLSPCVLPLVPAYIGYMGGRVTNTVAAQTRLGNGGAAIMTRPTLTSRLSTFMHGIAFVAGFTLVFVAIGLLGTAFVSVIGRGGITAVTGVIGRAGGLVIIFFGLHFMGAIRWASNKLLANPKPLNTPLLGVGFAVLVGVLLLWIFEDWLIALPLFAVVVLWLILGGTLTEPQRFWTDALTRLNTLLYTDTRREMVAERGGNVLSSAVMGLVFAAGWTPCIGPVYGTILTVAATGGDVTQAGVQMVAYSLGLGIPFLIAALMLDSAQAGLRRLQRHLHTIELVSGAFLVLIGVLVASGRLQALSQSFANQFADFSYRLEECAIELNQGEIGFGEFISCVNAGDEPIEAASDPAGAAGAEVPSITGLASEVEVVPVGLEVGQRAPDFASVTPEGDAISLSDLRGRVVLLNFWATWCGPCRIEMPEFQAAYTAHADDGLTILAVNNAEAVEDVLDFRDNYELTFPLVMDENADINAQYGVMAYPSTFLIDRNGVIIARQFGPMTAEQIAQLVDDALA